MRLLLTIGFLLASAVAAQAQQGGTKHRNTTQAYATAAGNASYAQAPTKPGNSLAGSYTSLGNIEPWDGRRTCY